MAYNDNMIKKPFKTGLGRVVGSIASTLLIPGVALADTDLEITSLSGTPDDPGQIIAAITNTLLTVAGVIAVIMVIVGGIMYALSAGDSNKAGKAKDTILYAVIGLAITMLAYAIVNFVIGQLN